MKYKVFDKVTKEDITNKYDWVIRPNGKLYYLDYGDLIGYPNAMYVNELISDEVKQTVNSLKKLKYYENK